LLALLSLIIELAGAEIVTVSLADLEEDPRRTSRQQPMPTVPHLGERQGP